MCSKKSLLLDDLEFLKTKRQPKTIKIDVKCKENSIILASDLSKPRATRSRSSKSKTPVQPDITERSSSYKDQQCSTNTVKSTTVTVPKKRDGLNRKKGEALGILNSLPSSTQRIDKDNTTKRKRVNIETEITAENIPLEAVFPVLEFGLNKDMCPKKKRRLQSLICPTP